MSVDTLSLWVEVLSVLLEELSSWAGTSLLQRETLIAGSNIAPGSDFTVGKSHSKVIVIRAGVNRGHLFWGDLADIYLKHLMNELATLFKNTWMNTEVCCQHSSVSAQSVRDSKSNKPVTHTCPIPYCALRPSVWIRLIVVDLNG